MGRAGLSAQLIFGTFDEAKEAEHELRAAGYETEITDEADIYGPATWMNVSRASAHWEEVMAIIDPLGGLMLEWEEDQENRKFNGGPSALG